MDNTDFQVKLFSGDILTFNTCCGYTFNTLRSEFYIKMNKELEILQTECISVYIHNALNEFVPHSESQSDDIFDDMNFIEVNYNDEVLPGNVYYIFINKPEITVLYNKENDSIRYEHIYTSFPLKAYIKLDESVLENIEDVSDIIYYELYDYFYNQMEEYMFSSPNLPDSLDTYLEKKYGSFVSNRDIDIKNLIVEDIKHTISNKFEVL